MANFENISIEKGMYQTKGGLTDALEKLDPSENYLGTALEGLDAFSRQLKRFDIKVKGRGSDCVEKFFQTSNSAALFPEYVSRAVKQGMERAECVYSHLQAFLARGSITEALFLLRARTTRP